MTRMNIYQFEITSPNLRGTGYGSKSDCVAAGCFCGLIYSEQTSGALAACCARAGVGFKRLDPMSNGVFNVQGQV